MLLEEGGSGVEAQVCSEAGDGGKPLMGTEARDNTCLFTDTSFDRA